MIMRMNKNRIVGLTIGALAISDNIYSSNYESRCNHLKSRANKVRDKQIEVAQAIKDMLNDSDHFSFILTHV
jgi:hypothetical protein